MSVVVENSPDNVVPTPALIAQHLPPEVIDVDGTKKLKKYHDVAKDRNTTNCGVFPTPLSNITHTLLDTYPSSDVTLEEHRTYWANEGSACVSSGVEANPLLNKLCMAIADISKK
jgi:hypothetical protein